VLIVDSAMLTLVCVLECLDLTGLELHEWLGFALCPLVLLHVIWKWPWFTTQFRKSLRAPDTQVRVNALLNTILLVLMSAVLLSGVLNSNQSIPLVGERFGSIHVWREMHNWLNFTLLAWVALHLGLNWDWVVGLFTPRRRGSQPAAKQPLPMRSMVRRAQPLCGDFRHGLTALTAVILSAGIAYFAMAALLGPPKNPPRLPATRQAKRPELLPQPRPIMLPHGFEQLSVTCGLVLTLVLVGRYVFRLRL
jgi:hypothetical protein